MNVSKVSVNVFLNSGMGKPSKLTQTLIEESEMYQPILSFVAPTPQKYSVDDAQKSGQIKTKNTREAIYQVEKWEFFPQTKTRNVYVFPILDPDEQNNDSIEI